MRTLLCLISSTVFATSNAVASPHIFEPGESYMCERIAKGVIFLEQSGYDASIYDRQSFDPEKSILMKFTKCSEMDFGKPASNVIDSLTTDEMNDRDFVELACLSTGMPTNGKADYVVSLSSNDESYSTNIHLAGSLSLTSDWFGGQVFMRGDKLFHTQMTTINGGEPGVLTYSYRCRQALESEK